MSKQTRTAASETAITKNHDSSMFASALASTSFVSSQSSSQQQQTASQPPRSAVSLASLLGVNELHGGAPTSSKLEAISADLKALSKSSSFSLTSSSKSSTSATARMADVAWQTTEVDVAAALQLIALREIKVWPTLAPRVFATLMIDFVFLLRGMHEQNLWPFI